MSYQVDPTMQGDSSWTNQALKDVRLPEGAYDYPDQRDWRPGSALHEAILEMLQECIRDSYDEMSQRHEVMREMDSIMTAYIPLSDYERAVKGSDKRKPVAIQVPLTYGIMQTVHTNYLSLLSSNEALDRFKPIHPDAKIPAMLMEELLKAQSIHYKELLAHSVQCMDFLKYGFGVQTPVWTVEYEKRRVFGAEGNEVEDFVSFEGNRVLNIDPYLCYPDPNCAITNVQDMEYFGYDNRTNLHSILGREDGSADFGWINGRYLKVVLEDDVALTNYRIQEVDSGHENAGSNRRTIDPQVKRMGNVVHETMVYKWMIPSMFEYTDERGNTKRLGDGTSPELWMFVMAGDKIILKAERSPDWHERIPITVAAPESDGYGCSPMAHLEMTRGLQDTINFRVNMENVFFRKFSRGRWMGDPNAIDMYSLLNGEDFIGLDRTGSRGRGINDVLAPVPIDDPFRGTNVNSIAYLQDVMHRASGATDPLAGVLQARGERRSATEAQGARMGALSRIEKMLMIAGLQSHQDLGYLKMRQTQQYLSDVMYVEMQGRNQEKLMREYGKRYSAQVPGYSEHADGMFPVNPLEMDVAMSVLPIDVTRRGEEFAQQQMLLLQLGLQNPIIYQQLDITRMYKHVARLMGANNIEDFMLQGGALDVQAVPDEVIQNQLAAGGVQPLDAEQPAGGTTL